MSVVQLLEKENKNLKEKKKVFRLLGKPPACVIWSLVLVSKHPSINLPKKNVVPPFRAFWRIKSAQYFEESGGNSVLSLYLFPFLTVSSLNSCGTNYGLLSKTT